MPDDDGERLADFDSEYVRDAVSDIDAEDVGFEPRDPESIPPDEGDAGPEPPLGEPVVEATSGLSRDQRIRCRDRVVQAARLGLANASRIDYTLGGQRWEGIARRRNASLGQYPTQADCSSYATWCLWNGFHLLYGLPDVVNGANWTGGYTGTMQMHGRRVRDESNLLRGDCVFYHSPRSGGHVTIVVGRHKGVPMVISHGSAPGPFYLRFDYRSDITEFRRYI